MFPQTPHAKVARILSGSIRADDGTVKGPGDEITIGADQVDRFPGQLEYLHDVVPTAGGDASSSAGPAADGHEVD